MSQQASVPDPSNSTPPVSQLPAPRRPLIHLTNWQIILILLVVIGGRLVIDFSQRIVEGQQKLSEQRALEAQIAILQAERKSLEAARIYYSSQAYIESWAHDQGKMVRDGEKLVIPLYQQSTSEPVPALPSVVSATLLNTSPSTWQVWWSLFFDDSPPLLQRDPADN